MKLFARARAPLTENWPAVPMASVVEQMASKRMPIGEFAPNSPAARRFNYLWQAIERRLAKG